MKNPKDLTLTTRDAPSAESVKIHYLSLQIEELQHQNINLKERNAYLSRKLVFKIKS